MDFKPHHPIAVAPSRQRAVSRLPRGPVVPGLLLTGFLLTALAGLEAFAQVGFGSLADGQQITRNVSVAVEAAGTLAEIGVLTLGVPNADFTAAASGSTCAVGRSYVVGENCVVSVTFTPAFPGVRCGAIVLLDAGGDLLALEYLSGTGIGALGILVPGEMSTYAGTGAWASVDDGGPATSAQLDLPSGVALDGAGNVYIADSAHNRIRMVDAATGIIKTVAGNGDSEYKGDDGPATAAALNGPRGVAIDGAGILYIGDTGNNVIRKVGAPSGIITTIAGSGNQGFTGDGGPAILASLASPGGITVDAAGRLYIADTANHRIRTVDPATGTITTVAGNGETTATGNGSYSGDGGPATQAGLNFPYAVGFDALGNLYIPDSGNQRIRVVFTGTGSIATFAGTGARGFAGDNGAAGLAKLNSPSGVVFDTAGNLYIADAQNNRIRKINATTGVITTVVGNGAGRYSGDKGSAAGAGLFGPFGVALDPLGNLFIADYFDHRIRKVSGDVGILAFTTPVTVGQVSAAQSQLVENDGNAALAFANFSPGANTAVDAASTVCAIAVPLAADSSCAVGVEFAPTEAGAAVTGDVSLSGSFVNSPLEITATGTALSQNTTTLSLTSSLNPTIFGQGLSLLAIVSTGTGAPTGTIALIDGASPLAAPIAIVNSGSASYAWANPTVGIHSVVATYSGDAQHLPSSSNILAEVVDEATATSLASSQSPSLAGASTVFSASVTSQGGGITPSGAVGFYDGPALLGSGMLDGQGKASFSTNSLAVGLHSITASYEGNASAYVLRSVSAPLSQQIQTMTSTLIASSVNPAVFGSPVAFTATVVAGASGTSAGGPVNFFDQTSKIGSAFLVPSGGAATASFTTSTLSAGLHSISAMYVGTSDSTGSASTALPETVEYASTSVTAAATPNPSLASSPVVLTATIKGADATGNGELVFLVDGASLGSQALDATGTASLSNSTLAVGQHVLVANYLGGTNNAPSISSPFAFAVQPIPTTTSLTIAPPQGTSTQSVLTATVAGPSGPVPTGIVSFESGATIVGAATLSAAGVASLTVNLASGVVSSLAAVYPGDLLHSPSASAQVATALLVVDFQILVNPPSVTLATTQNANVGLTILSAPGFTDQIGFGCASLPAFVTCHFSSDSILLAAGTLTNVQLTIDTDSPLSGGTVANAAAPRSKTSTRLSAVPGGLATLGALFLCVFRRPRNRSAPWGQLLLVIVCVAAASSLPGCGAISQNSAAPGSYVIQVVGTGVNSGVTEAVSLGVTVTQ